MKNEFKLTVKTMKTGRMLAALALVFVMALSVVLAPESLRVNAAENGDVCPDTWVGTDELGRVFPTNEETGSPKSEKYVGIFYFLFLNSASDTVVDVTATYLEGGVEAVWEIVPLDGFKFWARPYFGYYRNNDEWIYRKHAQLLTDAGVDFVFLDITNDGGLFEPAWLKLLDTWRQVRDEGGATPQVVFHCGDNPDTMVKHCKIVYDDAYSKPEYSDLWFMWEGKPLILGNAQFLKQQYIDYFTIRRSWAFNSFTGDGIERWPWIAEYPQLPGKNAAGEIEQIVVASGFHSNSSKGRSYSNEFQPSREVGDFGYGLETMGDGIAFAEQWERVFEIDPKVVMITGWNEFTYGRWKNAGIGQMISDSYHIIENDLQFESNYVDAFSAEFSRDIEPISYLFGDNYYYQMVENIRRFKGVREIPKGEGSVAIDLNGDFSEFENVTPEFLDTVNDTTERNGDSVAKDHKYVNTTGRNDFVSAKVSKTGGYTYFLAECAADITEAEGANWMNLFVDSDCSRLSGWQGYDFLLGRSRENGKVSVEEFTGADWESTQTVGWAEYSVRGNKLVIKVEDALLDLASRDNFDFKWADNSTTEGEIMQFMDLGDAAPNSRFNYRYIKSGGRISSELRETAVAEESGFKLTAPVIAAICGAGALLLAAILYIIISSKKSKKGAAAVDNTETADGASVSDSGTGNS